MKYILLVSTFLLSGFLFVSCQNVEQEQDMEAETQTVAYDEPYRPQFHFTPQKNWMNDPNGLVYYDGEYHLFYQHNPFGDQWGHMSWGHAVSKDLLHWEHLPVALEEEDGIMIFSGSAVVDKNNTSGLGTEKNPPMVAIYTGHHTDEDNPKQDQRIAYSTDNGRTWTKYEGNPVIDEGLKNFRDPKVIWHEATEKWIMVVALPTQHKVRFYSSANLIDWQRESEFGPAGGTDGIWECPDLFKLPVDGSGGESKWVLQVDLNPGSVAGGSGGQYFVGEFDGHTFTQSPKTKDQTLWVDYGKDFYAVQSFSNAPNDRRIWLAWMNNWEYAGDVPTDPWRGAMTIPREVGLRATEGGARLYQKPVKEIKNLYGEHQEMKNITVSNETYSHEALRGTTYKLRAEIKLDDADRFGLKVRKGKMEETIIGYDVSEKELFVDRQKSGQVQFQEKFANRVQTVPLKAKNGSITLEILVDRSSVEVFANNGERVITDRIFPDSSSQGIEFFSSGGAININQLDFWSLQSVWDTTNNSQ
ncbi:MAG TPA: glycoside hydrolase family 32 protein [Fodinibius sp.]|nr:glycoside hydrolase family 32 protein [Fodinibius sp.]